jgi:ADP-ribosylation factor-binding protein GGA
VQHRILESIEEWRQTICQTSRYKDYLGFIRDMHRLLVNKGYSFPEVRLEDAAVLNESDVRYFLSVDFPSTFLSWS